MPPSFSSLFNRAKQLLRRGTGDPSAEFREGQWEAIRELLVGGGRLFLIQRAGWGKSYVYFIVARLLRESGRGPTLLVSPLLSLMRNQIVAAERMGVSTATINYQNLEEWEDIRAKIENDELDVLLVSPERFNNPWFRDHMLPTLASSLALFVVDEAHCISDWGHDFRPDYRRIQNLLLELPENLRVLATTATANKRVVVDVGQVLGAGFRMIRGDLGLPNIALQTITLKSQGERLAWLAENLRRMPGSGIIYVLTIADANRVAGFLRSQGYACEAYHGNIESADERTRLEDALLRNEVKALVATTALGMGFDKPDLKFVIHFQSPASPVAYYQQVGRAGRAVEGAYGVLLSGEEEDDINDYFINSAFPTVDEADVTLNALESASDGLTNYELAQQVNLPISRINKALELLAFETPSTVGKDGSRWYRTPTPRPNDIWIRVERVTRLRREEQAAMKEYVTLSSGHMEFLLRQLDSPGLAVRRGNLARLPDSVNSATVNAANRFLRRQWMTIEPRKQWPSGFNPTDGNSTMSLDRINEIGRVLSIYGDGGWGQMVKILKYGASGTADELVRACVEMYADWSPDPVPTWVTSVPTRRGSDLVASFARKLAHALELDYVETIATKGAPDLQKSMLNSYFQAKNAWEAFDVLEGSVPSGPVLLVDDLVDSRWSFTVCGYLLRAHGSGPVYPLALAQTTPGGSN